MKVIFMIICMMTGGLLATTVAWAKPMFPVPPIGGLPVCEAELVVCSNELGSCDTDLDTCTTDLTTCDTDLDSCEATVRAFPATGQTSCWDSSGNQIYDCSGTGQDGDIQAGADLSYTDTGLTIIDNNTKLEWMKQDWNTTDSTECDSLPGSLSIICFFTWNEAFAFVASLNASAFADHMDWRVPNVKELQSIVNYENFTPAVSDVFNTECTASCTIETCSCTNGAYMSSTTYAPPAYLSGLTENAWVVNLHIGRVVEEIKSEPQHVRAVRGGL